MIDDDVFFLDDNETVLSGSVTLQAVLDDGNLERGSQAGAETF
jgi:hypothetical protein